MAKKRVLVIVTGGTISAKLVKGIWKPGKLNEKGLLKFIPELRDFAQIHSLDLFNIDSSNMQPRDWIKIAEAIKNNYLKYEGFLITHGTDTMHYTASALSFLLQSLSKPIVLTGSQIPLNQIGSDTKRNLIDSMRVITEMDMHEVLIVFNSKIFRGNRTKKFREVEFEAFENVGVLPLGVVERDIRLTGEHYYNKNKKLRFFNKLEKKVCIIKVTPGLDPKIISKLLDLGYKGIILEGFGAGNLPINENSLIPEIEKAIKKRIPIVISTQCAVGYSWVNLYECGKEALDAGAIPGHDMLSETAMIKLMWIIGNFPKKNIQQIKRLFLKDISGEISNFKTPKDKKIWDYSL